MGQAAAAQAGQEGVPTEDRTDWWNAGGRRSASRRDRATWQASLSQAPTCQSHGVQHPRPHHGALRPHHQHRPPSRPRWSRTEHLRRRPATATGRQANARRERLLVASPPLPAPARLRQLAAPPICDSLEEARRPRHRETSQQQPEKPPSAQAAPPHAQTQQQQVARRPSSTATAPPHCRARRPSWHRRSSA